MVRGFAIGVIVLGFASGCSRASPPPADPPAAAGGAVATADSGIAGRDWELVSLGDRTGPVGAGGKPVTLRFDAATGRAAGFAGCNRYSAGYRVAGDSLRFEAAISTKMACDQGMDLESAYLGVLGSVERFQAGDSTLTLLGAGGPVAGFRTSR